MKSIDFGNTGVSLNMAPIDEIAYWPDYQNERYYEKSLEINEKRSLEWKLHRHNGQELGDGIGGSDARGKFLQNAVELKMKFDEPNEDDPRKSIRPKEVTVTLADLGDDNVGAPIQVSVDLLDKNGDVFSTVKYVLKVPKVIAETPGRAMLNIRADDLLAKKATDAEFFNEDVVDDDWDYMNADAEPARQLFNDSKLALQEKLNSTGTAVEDLTIGRVKYNATNASITFNEIGFVNDPGVLTPAEDDLIGRNEKEEDLLKEKRGTSIADYGPANAIATGSVAQNNEGYAYVLISHGPDGEGSYRVGTLEPGVDRQFENISDAEENDLEVANYRKDNEFYVSRKIVSTNQKTKFDDVVLWDSQLTLYNALRNGSCETAQTL